MLTVYQREIATFFSSLIGYIVIGLFLLVLGLFVWGFPGVNILDGSYATLDPLFSIAPSIFTFLIPAITMRSFAEEQQTGTIELLLTRPISDTGIVLGKFLSSWTLVLLALLPTLVYFYAVSELGSPPGNLDSGAVWGSYLGLLLLGGVFTAIGIFASATTPNQIVAFLLGAFLCFVLYWAFFYLSQLPLFYGGLDRIIQEFGIDYHYDSISRGLIDTRDLLYFFSVMVVFLSMTWMTLRRRKAG